MSLPTMEGLVPLPKAPVPKHVEEAVKLTGTYVNGLAVGVAITGGIGPVFAILNGPTSAPERIVVAVLSMFVCFGASGALHFIARRYVLQELRR